MGLATPLAVLTGTTRGASKGILIKGGDVIERAKDIDTVVLDKTGTVTEGKPHLQSFKGIGIPDADALRLASCLERCSEHSIGKAIIQSAGAPSSCRVSGFAAHPGKGIEGEIEGKRVLVGSRRFMEEEGILMHIEQAVNPGTVSLHDHEKSGATVVYLSCDQRVCGVFTISDRVREEAGDGINDAPALVQADVGIAMGRATDIALESADMVLMRSDLRLIPEALRLLKKTCAIIRQNLFWAFVYNMASLPLAVAGMLHPVVAAAAMALSSLCVVGNSMRLRRG